VVQSLPGYADIARVDKGPAGERGFTLIELVMALTLLSIVIAGVAGVFNAAVRTSGDDLHRATAVGLATRATEELGTYPYDSLGLPDGTTPGGAPGCDAGVAMATVDPSIAVAASDPATVTAGITYRLSRCITWARASTGQADAYKGTTVIVAWTDQGGPHVARQDSSVYPGGRGPHVDGVPTTTTTSPCGVAPAAPASLAATVDDQTVQLTWTTPTSPVPIRAWKIDYNVGTGASSTYSTDGAPAAAGVINGNVVFISGLAPATIYNFSVAALGAPGCPASSPSLVARGTASAFGFGGCRVGLVSVSSSVQTRDAVDSHLSSAVGVNVATNGGSCGSFLLSFQPSSPASAQIAVLHPVPGGGAWVGTLPAAIDWTLGNHTIAVTSNGTVVAQANLCVRRSGARTC
jgi:prepilin-type N-terminal cleavage/methylation domain-containing protein